MVAELSLRWKKETARRGTPDLENTAYVIIKHLSGERQVRPSTHPAVHRKQIGISLSRPIALRPASPLFGSLRFERVAENSTEPSYKGQLHRRLAAL